MGLVRDPKDEGSLGISDEMQGMVPAERDAVLPGGSGWLRPHQSLQQLKQLIPRFPSIS
jgi:hypothetical protein